MPHHSTGSENSAGCFTVWFRNLLTTLRGPSKQDDKDWKRILVLRGLTAIYESIKENKGKYGDSHSLDLHRIKWLELPLDKGLTPTLDTFFIPMTKEELDQYPPDLTHEDTKRRIDNRRLIWDRDYIPEWLRERNPANSVNYRQSDAQLLCNLMAERFVALRRKDPESNGWTTMMKVAGWKHGKYRDSLVEERFEQDLFGPIIVGYQDPFEASNGHPHVMFTMCNGFPSRNESLYCYEIRAILAVMISQLNKPALKKHKVVPVKVLSFFGWDGRILEAHYDSDIWRLVVKVSHLYDFSSPEVAFPNADLFLRHMTCKITGNTEDPEFSPISNMYSTHSSN